MKRRSFVLSLLALALIVCTAISPALAYFTANARADGAVPLTLGSSTEIHEDLNGLTKSVTISNDEGDPVWIRAIVYVGSTYAPYLSITPGDWTGGTGNGVYYYYPNPVPEGQSTTALTVALTDVPDTGEFYVETFNVSVQYESIPVLYDENGDPIPWNTTDPAQPYGEHPWENPLDIGTTSPDSGNP